MNESGGGVVSNERSNGERIALCMRVCGGGWGIERACSDELLIYSRLDASPETKESRCRFNVPAWWLWISAIGSFVGATGVVS